MLFRRREPEWSTNRALPVRKRLPAPGKPDVVRGEKLGFEGCVGEKKRPCGLAINSHGLLSSSRHLYMSFSADLHNKGPQIDTLASLSKDVTRQCKGHMACSLP